MTARLKILTLALLLVTSACVSAGTEAIKDTGGVNQIEVGKSTRSDVVTLLGYPFAATHKEQGLCEVTWHYYYATSYPNATELIPVAKAFVTPHLCETTRILSVTFKRDGTVKSLKEEQIPLPAEQVFPPA
jgi:outer membrane protein assembly factor BamE (lipoprotein component of BamABCDE complex)